VSTMGIKIEPIKDSWRLRVDLPPPSGPIGLLVD